MRGHRFWQKNLGFLVLQLFVWRLASHVYELLLERRRPRGESPSEGRGGRAWIEPVGMRPETPSPPAAPMTALADLGLVTDATALLVRLAERLGVEIPRSVKEIRV